MIHFIVYIVAAAAVVFLMIVGFGMWLGHNRKRYRAYPLPDRELVRFKKPVPPQPGLDDEERITGRLVEDTADGKRWQEIAAGTCPHCHDPVARFKEGPQGGMSVNIQCVNCGWWFNVTPLIGIAQDIGFKDRGVH